MIFVRCASALQGPDVSFLVANLFNFKSHELDVEEQIACRQLLVSWLCNFTADPSPNRERFQSRRLTSRRSRQTAVALGSAIAPFANRAGCLVQ